MAPLQVMEHEGISFEGHLADSSSQLFTMLIHVVHEFTVSTSVSPIQTWIACLESDIDSQAMTKHDTHIRYVIDLLEGL